jgi:Xaa-Pro dipeptidase
MNEAAARSKFKGEIVVFRDALADLEKFIGKKQEIHCDFSSMTASLYLRLSKIFNLKNYSVELSKMRAIKTSDEVSKTQKAVKITKEIFDSIDFTSLKTELDLKKYLLMQTLDKGLEMAFEPIVSTDSNTRFPHYHSANVKLGGLILIDYGVKFDHYCADLTRCFILDSDKKKLSEYEKLQGVCNSIIDELPALKSGRDVAKFSDEQIAKAGFPKLIHSIGHGVGIDVHEVPSLGPKSDDKIAKTILAIEPAFYHKYGMRYEETVWFDGKKARIL